MSATGLAYETEVLTKKLSSFIATLRGTGLGEGEIQRALQVEAGQCAWKITQRLGPSSNARANKILDSEIRSQLSDKPQYVNLDESQQYSRDGDFTWLAAGPSFLVGISDDDNRMTSTGNEAIETYYAKKQQGRRGNAWIRVWTRGQQSVIILNRVRMSSGALNSVRRSIGSKFGQSKAAFARTAVQYLRRTFPAWITRNIPVVIENGKSILDDTGLNNIESPYLDFGSRAPGVMTNPKMLNAIRGGVIQSQMTLAAKCRKIIAGMAFDWNTGQVFKKTEFEDN